MNMKKLSFIFLVLLGVFMASCEQPQPESPQSLIGHWRVIGDHWTADFDDEGELTISSVKYDCFHPYYYEATADSLYVYWCVNMLQPTPDPVACSYDFKGNNTLVIDGFNAIFLDLGSVADKIKKKERVILTRTSSLR